MATALLRSTVFGNNYSLVTALLHRWTAFVDNESVTSMWHSWMPAVDVLSPAESPHRADEARARRTSATCCWGTGYKAQASWGCRTLAFLSDTRTRTVPKMSMSDAAAMLATANTSCHNDQSKTSYRVAPTHPLSTMTLQGDSIGNAFRGGKWCT